MGEPVEHHLDWGTMLGAVRRLAVLAQLPGQLSDVHAELPDIASRTGEILRTDLHLGPPQGFRFMSRSGAKGKTTRRTGHGGTARDQWRLRFARRFADAVPGIADDASGLFGCALYCFARLFRRPNAIFRRGTIA